jgi:hypothetical protein
MAAVFDFEVSDLLKKNLHTPSEFSHFPQKKIYRKRENMDTYVGRNRKQKIEGRKNFHPPPPSRKKNRLPPYSNLEQKLKTNFRSRKELHWQNVSQVAY